MSRWLGIRVSVHNYNDEPAILDEHRAEDRRTAVRHAVMVCPKQALRLLDD